MHSERSTNSCYTGAYNLFRFGHPRGRRRLWGKDATLVTKNSISVTIKILPQDKLVFSQRKPMTASQTPLSSKQPTKRFNTSAVYFQRDKGDKNAQPVIKSDYGTLAINIPGN
ncbi:uncharacterized protein [Bombus fervidus]|uniref:uncharacterized protein n=1 Tax=Bombus fervidus TaxID=203811 RepID=UPI003D18D157